MSDILERATKALEELFAALAAIAEGYPVSTKEDRYIVVENPAHQEDNGSAPKLVIDAFARTGVPELLDEVKRLRGQFEKIEDAALGGYLSPDLVASITHEALKVTP